MMLRFLLFALLSVALTSAENMGPEPVGVNVTYEHDGVALQGFLSVPSNETGPVPALVIIPDWDGANYYEWQRATMTAEELGYVGFAADIYGANYTYVEDRETRMQLAGFYRNDPQLFSERIQAAVDYVKALPEVDSTKVAIAGYCFGGSGVLQYALQGYDDVVGLVSIHGGLGDFIPENGLVKPKLLVLSGGEDDTSTEIMDLETTLNNANASWEITRYSDIVHAWTKFNSSAYNAWADMRTWQNMAHFLEECFGSIVYETNEPNEANVVAVPYVDELDGKELQGYLAEPSSEWSTPAPAIVIIPDWDGVNEYEQKRAQMLSDVGYVAFAADIYGADLQENLTMEERQTQTGLYRSNMTLFVSRMQRAIDEVKKSSKVDQDNIALIGYCFGGTGVIQYAFSGRDDAAIVVSFHGGVATLPPVTNDILPYTLILSGGEDDAHGNQTFLEATLNEANATWEISRYAGVYHSFTEWDADMPPFAQYNLVADARSWESMMTAFHELMPVPKLVNGAVNTTNTTTEQPNASSAATVSFRIALAFVLTVAVFTL